MIKYIKNFFKRLFCIHDYRLTDEFVLEGTDTVVLKRSVCSKCGKEKLWRWSPV